MNPVPEFRSDPETLIRWKMKLLLLQTILLLALLPLGQYAGAGEFDHSHPPSHSSGLQSGDCAQGAPDCAGQNSCFTDTHNHCEWKTPLASFAPRFVLRTASRVSHRRNNLDYLPEFVEHRLKPPRTV